MALILCYKLNLEDKFQNSLTIHLKVAPEKQLLHLHTEADHTAAEFNKSM